MENVWIVHQEKIVPSLLEGEGVVVLAGLAVSHQVAGLFAQPEQRLCIRPADRSVVPATRRQQENGGKNQEEQQISMNNG